MVRDRLIRAIGLCVAVGYAAFIVWLYISQPQTMAQVAGALTASVGAYQIDQQAFDDGLQLFRRGQFEAARAAFDRADPAGQDARTQFYVAYAFYRAGWGRLYSDNRLFEQGLQRIDRAIALAPGGRLVVEDPDLALHSADELRMELSNGLRTEAADLNPMRIFRSRK